MGVKVMYNFSNPHEIGYFSHWNIAASMVFFCSLCKGIHCFFVLDMRNKRNDTMFRYSVFDKKSKNRHLWSENQMRTDNEKNIDGTFIDGINV